jgi:hypothetical protein
MSVAECDVPSGSMLSRELIERAYFRDSYRAPLSHRELGIIDIFFCIFAHHPPWVKLLLIVRNKVASRCTDRVRTPPCQDQGSLRRR